MTHNVQHPFLMHASIAVALAYDRHLNNLSDCRRSVQECYHLSESVTLFNKRIKEPIETKDKDPIWGTAAALVILSFSAPDASIPEEAWPIRTRDPSDLEWLRMCAGKMSLWTVANPLRRDSLFRVMAPIFAQMHSPLPNEGISGIDRDLATVCQLKDSSTAETNPYFNAAHTISRLQVIPDDHVTTGNIEPFLRNIRGSFKTLLLGKDPVALLLLYIWYRKAGRSIWWIGLRARVECPAILSYLLSKHRRYAAVHAILARYSQPV